MNELFAMDILKMSRFHMLYLSLYNVNVKCQSKFKDPNINSVLELCA